MSSRAAAVRLAVCVVGGAVVLAVLLVSGVQARPVPPLGPVSAPRQPGEPAAGLEFFHLQSAAADTAYRLLVIPVRFPEDGVLGGGGRDAILARLNGAGTGALNGYYRAATGGRMGVVADLAPTVVAEHPRTYYTVEGDGNFGHGTDPNAYPHNARRLVEEVTAAVADRVDFRSYDNTGDGIADGLLLVHSGPQSIEDPDQSPPRDHLAAHAFTLESPELRGDTWIFPYAVAATRDSVGPWAHEMGHLLGFPDLYVSGAFCVGPGVGDWSLMATGANRQGGADPAGLDPYCRQLLGILPVSATGIGGAYTLSGGTAVRAFRFGAENGPQYFLVERRDGADGLGLDTPATVVYLVDEDAGDNASCPNLPESYRPLVEVRAVVCPGTGACTARLDDGSTPPLLDRDGRPTGLVLSVIDSALSVTHGDLPGARLERVGLEPVKAGPGGGERQAVRVVLKNLDPVNAATLYLDVTRIGAGTVCVGSDSASWQRTLAPGQAIIDTTWFLSACAGLPLPAETGSFRFTLTQEGNFFAHTDTVTLATRAIGLAYDPDAFTSASLASGRADPWSRSGSAWVAHLGLLTDGELRTQWFVVPEDGRVLLDHAWDLAAPSPDLALEGTQVRLHRQLAPDVLLTPSLGWGYTAARKSGNALAGTEVLSGNGSRMHVLDVSAFAGEMVRLDLRAASDVSDPGGMWTVNRLEVRPGPPVRFAIVYAPEPGGEGILAERQPGSTADPVTLRLFEGAAPVNPTRESWAAFGVQGDASLGQGSSERPRFELTWTLADGRAGAAEAILALPVRPADDGHVLVPPMPNPVSRGQGQSWTIVVPGTAVAGEYHLALVDVRGRRVLDRAVVLQTPGRRAVTWDGRDDAGRVLRSGVYFLQVRLPDGRTDSRKLVVIP